MSSNETEKKAEQLLKQEEDKQQSDDDLLALNEPEESEPEIEEGPGLTESGALKQEGEDEFNPSDYGGFPIEAWQRYFGAVNDKRQARSAALANRVGYNVRHNSAPKDSPYPEFDNKKTLPLRYYPVSKKLWEQRRRDLAEIEDMEREQQIQATKLAETQESLRLRIFARNKPRGMITDRNDPNKATLEEIQNNMKFFTEYEADIGRRLSEKRQASDFQAFQMYFHKAKDVYDQIMNEDLDDILRACDWKQIYGSANLKLSKPSSLQVPSQGIS